MQKKKPSADTIADRLDAPPHGSPQKGGDATIATARRTAEGIEVRVVLSPEVVSSRPCADYVTQENCRDMLGLTPRRFLELLRRDGAPPVTAVGKLRMVRREDILAFIARLGAKVRGGHYHERQPDGAEAVLREIGCASIGRNGGRDAEQSDGVGALSRWQVAGPRHARRGAP